MKNLKEYLEEQINENLIQAVLSAGRKADGPSKVKIRPVKLKDQICYQASALEGTKVFHKNYDREQMLAYLEAELSGNFGQLQCQGALMDGVVLVSKKGKMTIKEKHHAVRENVQIQAHNRVKQYILKEGIPVPFLTDLGVMTEKGKIITSRYDKFRQINRYLEFIEDVIDELPTDRTIRIIDFGCGKSYLTFAMYYYLHELQHRDIQVTGLDLKTDVIKHCNELAEKLGYDRLKFERGDISTYAGTDVADMVVTLHACDLATDYALDKAVKWGARVILAVPCCQHELNRQIKCDSLKPVLKYGIIKERIAALLTDALRANLLEQQGYETQILEYIDMEHTPKNLLIRAVKKGSMRPKHSTDIRTVEELLHVAPTLDKLLNNK